MKNLLFLFPVASLLISCSTLSEKDCRELNWFERGKSDVLNGEDWQKEVADYKKTCGKHSITINEKEYLKGVKFGGEIKCTKDPLFHDGTWFRVGKNDALKGREQVYLNAYSSFCSQFGVIPNENLYKKGFLEGIKSFCTYENGIKFGSLGGNYANTCPKNLERRFLKGYLIGTKEYHVKQLGIKVQKAKDNEEILLGRVNQKKNEISEIQEKLRNYDWKNRYKIDDISREIRDKESEIYSLNIEKDNIKISQLQGELSHLRSQHSIEVLNVATEKTNLESLLSSAENDLSDLRNSYLESQSITREWENKKREASYQAKIFRLSNP